MTQWNAYEFGQPGLRPVRRFAHQAILMAGMHRPPWPRKRRGGVGRGVPLLPQFWHAGRGLPDGWAISTEPRTLTPRRGASPEIQATLGLAFLPFAAAFYARGRCGFRRGALFEGPAAARSLSNSRPQLERHLLGTACRAAARRWSRRRSHRGRSGPASSRTGWPVTGEASKTLIGSRLAAARAAPRFGWASKSRACSSVTSSGEARPAASGSPRRT